MPRITIDVKNRTIKTLITELESGKYLLPSFQRQYVWDEDDIKDLIDSITNSYPIGTIILWKPPNASISEIDPFSRPLIDVNERNRGEVFYVIDGQQRLTSLLLLFKDWRITRDGEEIKCDIPISYNASDKKFYKSRTRGIDLSKLIKAFCLQDIDTLTDLAKETPKDVRDEMGEKIGRILDYTLPIYIMETYEESEETFRNMAEAFIRINKYGVRIGNLELMLSFLAGAISGELKNRIYNLYETLYETFEIELQPVIRFAFSNFDLKQTQISRVEQFKANISRISKYDSLQIEKIFNKCDKALKLTIELLNKGLGITNSRLLPSQTPLVPIASYFYTKDVNSLMDLDGNDIKNIINWFILANFNGYYSSQTDTKLDDDLLTIITSKYLTGYFPYDKLIDKMKSRKAKIKISELDIKRGGNINVLRREGRSHLFMLYIFLVKKEANDWSGRLLSQKDFPDLARHHIFPKEFLEQKLDLDDPDTMEASINNLANITFINKDINSQIGENAPENYMSEYISSAEKHFIPNDQDLWQLDNYSSFLEDRIKAIYCAGKELFGEIFE